MTTSPRSCTPTRPVTSWTRRLALLPATLLLPAMLMLAPLPSLADVGPDQAAAMAQRATGGRVLAVERADAGGRPVWRVKVVTGRGEVRIVLVDAASGRLM
jgi:hypothetical protein